MQRLDKQTKQLICELYIKDLLGTDDISKKLSIPKSTVYYILKQNKIKTRTTSEANRIYDRDSNYFEKIDSHEKAQILGFIYADGNITINKTTKSKVFQIGLSKKDKDYLIYIKDKLKYKGIISHYVAHKNNLVKTENESIKLAISDKKIVDDLLSLGVDYRKSLTIKFPTDRQVPKEFLNSFLLGLIEGDGTILIGKKKNKITPSYSVGIVVTKQMGESIQTLLKDTIKINCSLYLDSKYKYQLEPKNVYIISINGTNQVKTFLDWIYKDATFVMKRKHQKYLDMLEFLKYREENKVEIYKESNLRKSNKMSGNKNSFYNEKHTAESLNKMRKASQKTTWFIKNDEIYKITGVKEFCKENKLNYSSICGLKKSYSYKHKGWSRYDVNTLGIPKVYNEVIY